MCESFVFCLCHLVAPIIILHHFVWSLLFYVSIFFNSCLKINNPKWILKLSLTFIDKHNNRKKCCTWALRVMHTSGERHGGWINPEAAFFTWILWLTSKKLRQKFDLYKTLGFRNWLSEKKNKCLRIADNLGWGKEGLRASARDDLKHRLWLLTESGRGGMRQRLALNLIECYNDQPILEYILFPAQFYKTFPWKLLFLYWNYSFPRKTILKTNFRQALSSIFLH